MLITCFTPVAGIEDNYIVENSYAASDTNKDGTIDASEGVFGNKYSTFTPRMLKAAFNYMFVQKEPAAYLHNAKYVLQLMYDSIEDLSALSGVTTQGLTRP